MNKYTAVVLTVIGLIAMNCTTERKQPMETQTEEMRKAVVYQVFTRLFGNQNLTNKPWGTIEENGVGKFEDFTDKALAELKDLGVSHIWYTGVLHHATVSDYTEYGISNDDPDVVKGRAGSPYAVKDYYQVNPDLAVDPSKRLEEFEALIRRTHDAGMKVLIDIIPNHVARKYEGLNNPEGVSDFGANDDTSVDYKRDNNFYYIPGEAFEVPEWRDGYLPLGGEEHPLVDSRFDEVPAKWTGNGSRLVRPDMHDWYETVKINYGVRPDGTKDFAELPTEYSTLGFEEHYEFWKGNDVPDSWKKFAAITLFWLEKGVDGFRFDMAEMVPVEFWSYMNSTLKMKNPDAFLLAEVYNPSLYRDYIHLGKMDYLYDKVELYDTIKHIVRGHGLTDNIPPILEGLSDIEHHMLHFLENHDEQRIASPDFAGSAEAGKAAMVVSATVSTSPTMIYFGQELGEPGREDAGFGRNTRTSIFDYVGVPTLQRWVNGHTFDGGRSSKKELDLRDFYRRLLRFTRESSAMMGSYAEVHSFNREHTEGYDHRVFSFARWSDKEKLIVVSNFDNEKSYGFDLKLPDTLMKTWNLPDGTYYMGDRLYGAVTAELRVENGIGICTVSLEPQESLILGLEE
jgi:glycosidase